MILLPQRCIGIFSFSFIFSRFNIFLVNSSFFLFSILLLITMGLKNFKLLFSFAWYLIKFCAPFLLLRNWWNKICTILNFSLSSLISSPGFIFHCDKHSLQFASRKNFGNFGNLFWQKRQFKISVKKEKKMNWGLRNIRNVVLNCLGNGSLWCWQN